MISVKTIDCTFNCVAMYVTRLCYAAMEVTSLGSHADKATIDTD